MSLKPKAGKQTEIRQTLDSIVAAILTRGGCTGGTYTDPGGGASIELLQTWSDRDAVDAYVRSREHRALLGALETLCENHSVHIHEV